MCGICLQYPTSWEVSGVNMQIYKYIYISTYILYTVLYVHYTWEGFRGIYVIAWVPSDDRWCPRQPETGAHGECHDATATSLQRSSSASKASSISIIAQGPLALALVFFARSAPNATPSIPSLLGCWKCRSMPIQQNSTSCCTCIILQQNLALQSWAPIRTLEHACYSIAPDSSRRELPHPRVTHGILGACAQVLDLVFCVLFSPVFCICFFLPLLLFLWQRKWLTGKSPHKFRNGTPGKEQKTIKCNSKVNCVAFAFSLAFVCFCFLCFTKLFLMIGHV